MISECFFSWFSDREQKDDVDEIHDEVAELIKDDLWPNPLTYFNNGGKRVAVKYYSDDWPTNNAKLAFDKFVFTKTVKTNARRRDKEAPKLTESGFQFLDRGVDAADLSHSCWNQFS
ncbi:hypothetical protein JHK86_006234 [Glycine max]|nr:hypothetical protein JHK86_006234 [Glycine max]